MSNLSSGDANIINKINNDEYTLFDKILYGGLGYGHFCLPANIFKILFTIIFPPLGILIHNMGDPRNEFPYISIDNIKNIIKSMDQFIITLILTSLFYAPGLIYAFTQIKSNKSELDNDNDNENTIANFKNTAQNNKNKNKNKSKKSKSKKFNWKKESNENTKDNNYNKYDTKDLDLIRKRLGIE